MNDYRIIRGDDGTPIMVSSKTLFDVRQLSTCAIDEVSLNRIKDQKFQHLCKDLWPNIYNRIEVSEKEKECKKLLGEIDKKTLCDALIKNANEKKIIESCLATPTEKLSTNTSSVYAKMDAALASGQSNSNTTTPNINIYINGTTPACASDNKGPKPAPVFCAKPITAMSSYNYPFCTTSYKEMREKQCPQAYTDFLGMSVKPCLNETDENLITSIKETQAKLKMSQKIENTTELVDDLINKFSKLQSEMKEKASYLQLRNQVNQDMNAIERQFLERKSRSRVVSPCRPVSRGSICISPCRSKSREVYISPCRPRSRELCISPCVSVSPRRRRSRSHSRSAMERPVSIMKKSVSYGRKKSPAVTFRVTESRVDPLARASLTSSGEVYSSRDFFNVAPKVDCWNNKSRKDSNIY